MKDIIIIIKESKSEAEFIANLYEKQGYRVMNMRATTKGYKIVLKLSK